MTSGTQTRSSKTDRRQALETPYQRESEASVERAMSRGIQPRNLHDLVRWYVDVCEGEAPTAIHKRELWRDHGAGADGGSKLGTKAWSDPFRRFLDSVDHPSAVDGEGIYRYPLRAALSRLSRRRPLTARALYQLALMQGDWRRLAEQMSYPDEFMELYIEKALAMCWREYSERVMLT